MSALRDALLAVLFGPVGRLLPFGACRALARPIAAVAWGAGFRREIARRNLELAFPEISPEERDRIGRASLVNLFTVFLEVLTLRHLSARAIRRRLVVDNMSLLRDIGSNGGLLLSGHVGNWELLALGAAEIAGMPFAVMVKDQKDGRQLERMRTSRGNRLISTGRGAREASALLRNSGVVAMLADQSAPEEEHIAMLFGTPTHTYSAPARLALRFRPTVLVGFAIRESTGRYRATIEEIPHHDLPDTPEAAETFTARYVAALERAIREHPEQWVWQHRKWKNTPGVRYD